jgi:hypothetical protein
MLGKPPTRPTRSTYHRRSGGTPSWLVFLLGVAVVFGVYYMWQGFRDYNAARGVSGQATREAATLTAIAGGDAPRPTIFAGGNNLIQGSSSSTQPSPSQPQSVAEQPVVTLTPVPECMDFIITERANIRNAPNTEAGVVEIYQEGTIICVLGNAVENPDWYLLDLNPLSRRVNPAYVYRSLVRALNPTPLPTRTFTPAPTVTPMPTLTPSDTPTPLPTRTPDFDATDTPTPTPTITPTVSYQSA